MVYTTDRPEIADIVIDVFTALGKIKYAKGIPFTDMTEGVDYIRRTETYKPFVELSYKEIMDKKQKKYRELHGYSSKKM